MLASEQYTDSQRGKLKALASKPGQVKSRVRNFNIQDDQEALAHLGTALGEVKHQPESHWRKY